MLKYGHNKMDQGISGRDLLTMFAQPLTLAEGAFPIYYETITIEDVAMKRNFHPVFALRDKF